MRAGSLAMAAPWRSAAGGDDKPMLSKDAESRLPRDARKTSSGRIILDMSGQSASSCRKSVKMKGSHCDGGCGLQGACQHTCA